MALLFAYLALVLVVSFICSIMESVLLSLPVSYIISRIENGQQKAKKMLALKENVDQPLSAILSLNTVAHTVGAAGVGAQATIIFGDNSLIASILPHAYSVSSTSIAR